MISGNLKDLRKQHKLSQEDVAEAIGVSRQAVAKWENGDTTPDIMNCVALARLFLDEPTSGLDPVSGDELLDIFLELAKRGAAILFSTHITSDLDKCADHIVYIKSGSIVAASSVSKFMEDYGFKIQGTGRDEDINLEKIMLFIERGEADR